MKAKCKFKLNKGDDRAIEITSNIKKIAKQKNIKKNQIAKALGYQQHGLYRVLNNERNLTINHLFAIADVLEVNVMDIFTYPVVFGGRKLYKIS